METITSSAEISRLFTNGTWLKTPSVTLIIKKRDDGETGIEHDLSGRVAFIAGKKLGGAVWRNAAKRRMRAICHDLGGPWHGYDVIFLAKSNVTEMPYRESVARCKRKLDSFIELD